MDHRDPAIKTEMMRSEIDEIKANMESVSARVANLPDGPVRAEFVKDLADMKEELADREKDLADWLARPGAPPNG